MQYSSSEVDALLDKMGSLEFGEESIAIAKQIQKILSQDLPILYLVDPEWNVALSERLKDYKPYSGDYYIVNADLYQNNKGQMEISLHLLSIWRKILKYFIKWFLLFWGVSIVSFLVVRLLPVSPVEMLLQKYNLPLTEENKVF